MVAMRASLLLPLAGAPAMLAGCTVVQPPPPMVAVSSAAPTGGNQYCREYTITAIVDGKPQETVGTACQEPDGRWRIMDPGEGQAGAGSAPPQQGYYYAPYPYYYAPYPYYYPDYYGPVIGLGFGFRFGGHHHHGGHHGH
jgi:hypothetical protein